MILIFCDDSFEQSGLRETPLWGTRPRTMMIALGRPEGAARGDRRNQMGNIVPMIETFCVILSTFQTVSQGLF